MQIHGLQRKSIIYLVTLVGFATLSLLVVDVLNGNSPVVKESNIASVNSTTSSTFASNSQVEMVEDDGTDPSIIPLPSSAYAEVALERYSEQGTGAGSVLGCDDDAEMGCSTESGFLFQPICSRGETSIVVGDGTEVGSSGDSIKVTKNSKIEVWTVTVPMALLSGSEFVEDSRMAIQNSEGGFQGTFKPAYDIITDFEARAYCIPGMNCEDYDGYITNGPMGEYYVNVQAEMNEEALTDAEPDKAVIKPQLNSACPDVQKSKPNPKKSNRKGKFAEENYQLPGDGKLMRNFSSVMCLRASSAATETENHFACLENRTSFEFLVYAQVKIQDWIDCTIGEYDAETGEFTPPNPDLCKETVITSLKIDGLFGSVFKCFRNQCAIRYLDFARQGIMPPGQAMAMAPEDLQPKLAYNDPVVDPFYVSTPCVVRVDGIHFGDIPCIWDMSAYKADYDRQRAASGPGSADMPATFELYWQMVEEQIRGRGMKCS